MKTVIVDRPAGVAAMLLGVLRPKKKRADAVVALPEVTYVRPQVALDPAQIACYSRVCGFGGEHGVPIIYPQMLTFPLLMAFWGSDDCPWPAMGTVHLANRIEQRQALNPGDVVRVEASTGRMMAHDKGQIFTIEMKILRAGELIWEATQTLLRTGVGNPSGPAFVSQVAAAASLSHQADFAAPGNIGRRYGRVSGDRNPIHLSALTARLFGFRRAIAHGMWTKARALAALMPRAPIEQGSVAVEFKTPLLLPSRVSLWATREPEGSGAGRASFEVRNAVGDRPHLRGQLYYRTAAVANRVS